MNDAKRKALVEWLESMPWWKELPYAQLEAKLLAHQENEGDECPLCQLEAELSDIKESHRIVMDEKCPSDEVHCTCVPVLRAENEALRELWLERKDWYERHTMEGPLRTKFDVDIDALLTGEKK